MLEMYFFIFLETHNTVAHSSEGWWEKPSLNCLTSVDSSRSLGHTCSVHTIQSQRFSAGISTFDGNSILRYITRPFHNGNTVGVKGLQDGRRVSREAASGERTSEPPALLATSNSIIYPKLIPLIASGHSRPSGAPESEIIVRSMCVARAWEVSTDVAQSGEGFSHQRIGCNWIPSSYRSFTTLGVR